MFLQLTGSVQELSLLFSKLRSCPVNNQHLQQRGTLFFISLKYHRHVPIVTFKELRMVIQLPEYREEISVLTKQTELKL